MYGIENLNVTLLCDMYKASHIKQYNPKTEKVYSTWTPRKSRMNGINHVVVFGLQYFIKKFLIKSFNETFFLRPKKEVIKEFKRVMKQYAGEDDTTHWEALHDLGYLPLKISALEEGILCPIRCPMFTIENTLPQFYWLTNFIETIMSTEIWKPMTSATIALEYRKIGKKWAEKTCDDDKHVDYQFHDFSMRGISSLDSACSSGAGHLLSFKGSDTIPATLWLETYYNTDCESEIIARAVAGSEHAVQETNILNIGDKKEGEYDNLRNFLTEIYPTGTFTYVADTYNYWEVFKDILPKLKYEILTRDGTFTIRGDSGDPVDIICGLDKDRYYYDGQLKKYENNDNLGRVLIDIDNQDYAEQRYKGTVELLWDIFGGTINSKGYKVLNPHVSCVYGDAITLERAEEICRRLESNGFASSNVNFGVGSFTYNYNTRDTFGFALKATYGIVDGKELMLYKDPITDSGEKKSQKGMVAVLKDKEGNIVYIDELTQDTKNIYSNIDLLKPLFENGKLLRETSLSEIRVKLLENKTLVLT